MIAKPVRVIAVSAGKGGVGKSNISLNLAIALAQRGKKVLLLDADLGLANIDILLGMSARYNLSHVIQGSRTLEEIMLCGPHDLKIIPASSGTNDMAQLSAVQHAGLIDAFNELTEQFDYMIIDTAAGISDTVLSFTRSSHEIIVVVCDEPTSLTDSYAFIKVMSQRFSWHNFHILVNMVRSEKEGAELFDRLYRTAEQFLDVRLDYFGALPFDERMHDAVKKQQSVVIAYPDCAVATALHQLAERLEHWPFTGLPGGNTSFFLERMVDNAGKKSNSSYMYSEEQ